MQEDQAVFKAVSYEAQVAFEKEFPLPEGTSKPFIVEASGFPPAVIELLFRYETWAAIIVAVGPVAWLSKRVGVFVDEFSKGFAGEAGKDTWTTLKTWLNEIRAERKQASEAAKRLASARQAAEDAEGRPVRLVLGSPTGGLGQYVRVPLGEELPIEDAVLAYEAMYDSIFVAASKVFETRNVLFGSITVAIAPYGFRLNWIEDPFTRMWQAFLPDGTPLNEPAPTPRDSR